MKHSDKQHGALHLWFERIATDLNDAGYDQKAVFKQIKKLEIPNTKDSIKEIFRAIMKEMYPRDDGKLPSTNDLTPSQLSNVEEAFNRGLALRFQIHTPFPHEDEQ